MGRVLGFVTVTAPLSGDRPAMRDSALTSHVGWQPNWVPAVSTSLDTRV